MQDFRTSNLVSRSVASAQRASRRHADRAGWGLFPARGESPPPIRAKRADSTATAAPGYLEIAVTSIVKISEQGRRRNRARELRTIPPNGYDIAGAELVGRADAARL